MEIKWIQDFLSVAKTHSFSRSALERHVTQSALSRRIQALEAWVGVELIDRHTQPIQLTAAGAIFQKQAEEILRLAMEARSGLQQGGRSAAHAPGYGLCPH
jgi:DNA-binding transcriptional LysR family regulator